MCFILKEMVVIENKWKFKNKDKIVLVGPLICFAINILNTKRDTCVSCEKKRGCVSTTHLFDDEH